MVSHLANSAVAERCWCVLHTYVGPHLLCGWYRPGDQCIEPMFEEELEQYNIGMIAVSVIGDLNIHHKEWLKYSCHTTRDGEFMYQMNVK